MIWLSLFEVGEGRDFLPHLECRLGVGDQIGISHVLPRPVVLQHLHNNAGCRVWAVLNSIVSGSPQKLWSGIVSVPRIFLWSRVGISWPWPCLMVHTCCIAFMKHAQWCGSVQASLDAMLHLSAAHLCCMLISPGTALQTEVLSELWWGLNVQLDREGNGLQGCWGASEFVHGPLVELC